MLDWVYLGPSHNMLASRVYRPATHTVYNRYHVLYDSDVVYGDFMGDMYKKRVEADKMLRDYYNTEVSELLNGSSTNDIIRDIMCNMPWALQPLPEEHESNNNDSNNVL